MKLMLGYCVGRCKLNNVRRTLIVEFVIAIVLRLNDHSGSHHSSHANLLLLTSSPPQMEFIRIILGVII